MRLAFFTSGASTESVGLVRIADGLARRGYRPCIISMCPAGPLLDETKLPVYTLNMRGDWRNPRVLLRLIAILRDVKPHVLITVRYEATVLGRVIAPFVGVQFVISCLHRGGERSFLRHIALRATDRLARRTVTSTPRIAEMLAARGIVARRRLRVIPGVMPPLPALARDDALRRTYHIGAGDFVWLAAGALDRDGDYATLLDACAWLDDRTDGWRLLIAGEGRVRVELESRRDRLGLNERVHFLGFRSDLERLLADADGFVTSTVGEGVPDVLVEAMLAARPCLATDVGGIPDLIRHGMTGWLVPPRRPDRLADRMSEIMQLPRDQRAAVGESARDLAALVFDAHGVIDEWEDLLAEAARRREGRAVPPAMLTRAAMHRTGIAR